MVVICSLGAWASTDAVVNGGFETGLLDPWTIDSCGANCSTWTVESTVVHGGTYAAETTGSHEIMQTLPEYDGIHPGVFTGLIDSTSLWFKTSANIVAIELLYSGITVSSPTCTSPGVLCIDVNDGDWHDYGSYLMSDFQTGAGSGQFLTGILIGTGGSSSHASYLDDVSIMADTSFNPQPTPEPMSLLLIGSGAMALAALRLNPILRRK